LKIEINKILTDIFPDTIAHLLLGCEVEFVSEDYDDHGLVSGVIITVDTILAAIEEKYGQEEYHEAVRSFNEEFKIQAKKFVGEWDSNEPNVTFSIPIDSHNLIAA
jgi:hypothetical protein